MGDVGENRSSSIRLRCNSVLTGEPGENSCPSIWFGSKPDVVRIRGWDQVRLTDSLACSPTLEFGFGENIEKYFLGADIEAYITTSMTIERGKSRRR